MNQSFASWTWNHLYELRGQDLDVFKQSRDRSHTDEPDDGKRGIINHRELKGTVMSRKSWLLVAALFVAAAVGCGMSKEEISQAVKTSTQSKFDTDPQFKNWHLTVADVQVLSKGGNRYTGIARISYGDSPHDVAVDITVDGDQVMWKVPPGSFEFVLEDRQESSDEPDAAPKYTPQTAGRLIVNAVESRRLTLTDYARDLGFSLKANNG